MGIEIKRNDVIYIDMDGVLVQSGESDHDWKSNKYSQYFFIDKPPIAMAQEAFHFLSQRCEVYILSTPVWGNVYCWSEKRIWVEKYLGEPAKKRLILTHNKGLNKGKILIDDSLKNGANQFEGLHIHFGTVQFPTWREVLDSLVFIE
jgi:5'-nucleotidase